MEQHLKHYFVVRYQRLLRSALFGISIYHTVDPSVERFCSWPDFARTSTDICGMQRSMQIAVIHLSEAKTTPFSFNFPFISLSLVAKAVGDGLYPLVEHVGHKQGVAEDGGDDEEDVEDTCLVTRNSQVA